MLEAGGNLQLGGLTGNKHVLTCQGSTPSSQDQSEWVAGEMGLRTKSTLTHLPCPVSLSLALCPVPTYI